MPKGKKTGGRDWVKGQSGNPKGSPGSNVAARALRNVTYQQFIDCLQKYGHMTREEIAKELTRPDATMFDIMFGQVIASAAKGDKDSRAVLFDRLWGKVKDVVEQHNYDHKQVVESIPTIELVKLVSNGS